VGLEIKGEKLGIALGEMVITLGISLLITFGNFLVQGMIVEKW